MQGLHNAVHMSGLRLNDHVLAEKLLRRDTAQSLYPQKSFAVDVADDESDLIHMGCDQHAALFISLLIRNEVSHHVIRKLYVTICQLFS